MMRAPIMPSVGALSRGRSFSAGIALWRGLLWKTPLFLKRPRRPQAAWSLLRRIAQTAVVSLVVAGWLPAAAGAGIAIVGGTVYTLEDDAAREGLTILIADGRVRAVGPDLAVPAGYERIDADGRVITPGLIEPHSQMGLMEISGENSTVDTHVQEFRLGPAFDVQYAINPASTLLPVNRRDGVTRAIVAPAAGNDPLGGWGAAIRLGDHDVLTHARLALFGSIGSESATFVGGSRSAVVQRLRLGFEEARVFRPERYRSEHDDYTRHDMAALKSFLASGAPLVLSVRRASEIVQAVALKRDFGIPVVIHGGAEAWRVAGLLADQRVPVIVDVLDNLPADYDQLGARLDNATILWRAGVPVLLTAETSYNAGLLRQAAGNAVAEGMPWSAALAAVTRTPARVFGLGRGAGTLTPGAPADLVIWTGDPLELSTWADRVMIDGAWVSLESRQTRLLERYRLLEGEEPFGYR
jgi:imidazolonepropionase-like amidohydrolase